MPEVQMAATNITQEQQRHIHENFKIPVDSLNPRTYWITSLDRQSVMPSDEELRQIASYREFVIKSYYNPRYSAKLLEIPIPKDSGNNTTVFHKGDNRGNDKCWFYRRTFWSSTTGPTFQPYVGDTFYLPLSLVEVMDRIQAIGMKEWSVWKKEHADIFPQTN